MKLLALEAVQNAGYYQSRYHQVEEFGGTLFVLNGLGEPDYWPAARYRVAGSKHIDHIIAAAREWHADEQFDGVLTFSESGVLTVAAVAEALGLPGVGLDAARISRNKLLMREAQQRGGAPVPQFRLVPDVDAALAAADEFGYPIILKPTLGAASNFVFKINGPDELRTRFPQAVGGMARMSWFQMEADGIDLGPYGLLVESFLDGQEMQIEAVAWDDEVYLGSIVDRITIEGDTFDDDAHRAPTVLGTDDLAAVHKVVTLAAHAQGLRRSVMHAEVRFHEGRPHLLEIAVRPGGGGLDYFARLSTGYCPIRAAMAVAAGMKPDVHHYRPTGVHLAGTCLIGGPGRIEEITVPPTVSESDRVFFLKITAKPGDVVRRPPDGNNILGFLCTSGPTFDEAIRTAYEFAGQIDVRLALPAST
ncbi:ATP-grasp domain-containing protein [Kribbella catacumbae]|uniref:ATP-grasp domain-containing protein n=1 Tax=Kribbella catacumbae TaxID=460086 RepID=UPI00037BBA79|nr:ATP-grasp domain-containing protein [Kribbella catacumbae]